MFVLWAAVVIAVLSLCSCGQQGTSVESELIRVFSLSVEESEITVKELYNSYEGAPYEGIALYEISFLGEAGDVFREWKTMPYDRETKTLVESVSFYVEVPELERARYKMVNGSSSEKSATNASVVIYDEEENVGYYLKLDT